MHRVTPATLLLISLLWLGSACDRSSAGASYQVTDSAGVKLVMNGEAGAWSPDEVWQLREDLRIESDEDESLRQFGTIASVAVNSQGDIFVLDVSVPNIQQFDSTGAYMRTFGGAGEGPGQFGRAVREVLAGDGDSITVPDVMNQRVNVFFPDGQFARSFPIPTYPATPVRWETLQESRLAAQVNAMVMPGQTSENRTNIIVRVGPDGTIQDTILPLPLDPILDLSQGPASMKSRFFNSTAVWGTNGKGLLAVGMTGEYRLSVYGADGTLRMIFAKPHEPRPVSEADRAKVTESFKLALKDAMAKMNNEQARGMVEQMAGNIEFGATYPAFGTVRAGPEGTWLVRQPATVQEVTGAMAKLPSTDAPMAPPEWDVFDADGRFLGTIRFPVGFRLAAVAGGRFYGIETDSLDIPSVVRLTR
jgi:hypothetical protein